jgi:hypothetical protein
LDFEVVFVKEGLDGVKDEVNTFLLGDSANERE